MEIIELHIKNFGKFSDRHFYLNRGINIFYGENEYGKSTIYAFIKAMLFGMERGRGRAALFDEFSKYEPWENPNYYAGVMRFKSGGKTFRLERNFDRYSKKAVLLCEDDGEELSVEDGDLEMLLDGLTKKNFESTISVGQLCAKPGAELAEELHNYATNYYETGSKSLDVSNAFHKLEEKKKLLDKEKKLLYQKREKQRELLENECRYITREIDKLNKELAESKLELQERNQSLEEHYTNPNGTNLETKKHPAFISISFISLGIGMLLFWLRGFLKLQTNLLFGAIAVIFSLVGLTGIVLFMFQRNKIKKKLRKPEIGENKEALLKEQIRKQKWRSAHLTEEKREKQVQYQNILEQIEEQKGPNDQEKVLQFKREAIELAEHKMNEAVQKMSGGFGGVLNRKASNVLATVTEGKYTDLLVDSDMKMALLFQGKKIPVERVSSGTIEQVYFALRMAVTDLLFEEPLPLIFDEAFAFYDDKRLKSTLKWLREQPRQVIIFTCQRREMDIERIGI